MLYIVSYILLESVGHPDIHLKEPISRVGYGCLRVERRPDHTFLQGVTNSSPLPWWERKSSCWPRGEIILGSALRGDVEFRGSILKRPLVNPPNAEATFVQSRRTQRCLKIIWTLSLWYSLDYCWVLSYEYPYARVSVIFRGFALFYIGQISPQLHKG